MSLANTVNNYAQVSGDQASMLRGQHVAVYSGEAATRTLLDKESGATFLFDKVDGIIYTLPAPVIGARFRFMVKASVTSNAYKVQTDAATTFIVGGVDASSLTAGANDYFVANGTSHVGISMGGTTTGGLIGTWIELVCISSTLWQICGSNCGSGTLADPFV